jgi:hypothetical protein
MGRRSIPNPTGGEPALTLAAATKSRHPRKAKCIGKSPSAMSRTAGKIRRLGDGGEECKFVVSRGRKHGRFRQGPTTRQRLAPAGNARKMQVRRQPRQSATSAQLTRLGLPSFGARTGGQLVHQPDRLTLGEYTRPTIFLCNHPWSFKRLLDHEIRRLA